MMGICLSLRGADSRLIDGLCFLFRIHCKLTNGQGLDQRLGTTTRRAYADDWMDRPRPGPSGPPRHLAISPYRNHCDPWLCADHHRGVL